MSMHTIHTSSLSTDSSLTSLDASIMATKSSTPPPLATAEVAAVLAEAATVEDAVKEVEIRD